MYAGGQFPSRFDLFFPRCASARATSDSDFADDTDRRAAFALEVPKEDRSILPLN
jgi:hypothetical protein